MKLTLILVTLSLILSISLLTLASTQQQSIKWDTQYFTQRAFFVSVGMCKGTTEQTKKVGFIGADTGSIWRTLDGKTWQEVASFPGTAEWDGIYCFPDAKRVIAVGFSNNDPVLGSGPIITWSFDGGNTWTERGMLPFPRGQTWLGAVYFKNDTHGFMLPSIQDLEYVVYYTTNGGKTVSDWQTVETEGPVWWWQSHPIAAFEGGVTKTFADNYDTGSTLCSTDSAGASWQCDVMNRPIAVGSFASPLHAVGADFDLKIYASTDGGVSWNNVTALPLDINNAMGQPTDMVWIPNTEIVILLGGSAYPTKMGTVAHSLDGGVTWTESMPQLRPTMFCSVDTVQVSDTTTEVWAVGPSNNFGSYVLHATVTTGSGQTLNYSDDE